jgi:hypothetical protein
MAAASREHFPAVVELITPYLTPFDCWSMLDFRLFDPDDLEKHFKLINTQRAALGLLSVLDKTVGGSEDAVVPYDLPEALRHIGALSPKSANDPRLLRVETLGRR